MLPRLWTRGTHASQGYQGRGQRHSKVQKGLFVGRYASAKFKVWLFDLSTAELQGKSALLSKATESMCIYEKGPCEACGADIISRSNFYSLNNSITGSLNFLECCLEILHVRCQGSRCEEMFANFRSSL